MSDFSLVHRMMSYTTWADDVMLRNAEAQDATTLHAPRDTLFGSVAGTFDHTLVVAEIFQAHLEGRAPPHKARQRDVSLPFTEIARRLRDINAYFERLAGKLDEMALAEPVSFRFVGGGEGMMTREDILLHLANHATYHRGFVSNLLYPHKKKGAASDLTVFLRDVWTNQIKTVRKTAG